MPRRFVTLVAPPVLVWSGALMVGLGWAARAPCAEEGPGVEPAEKKEKPKIPPLKYSAWCAFRDFAGVQQTDLQRPPDPDELAASEHTRPGSARWGGYGRRGQWVALVVELQNTTEAETFTGNLRVGLDPVSGAGGGEKPYTTRYREGFELAPGTTQLFHFSVLCPEADFEPLEIAVTANGRAYSRFVTLHELDRFHEDLIVVVSEQAGAYKYLLKRPVSDEGVPDDRSLGRQVAVVRPEDLPRRWYDLTLANLIILDGPPREGLTGEQLDALTGYCQAGGQVLISSGQDPARLKAAEGGRLSLAELAGLRVNGLAKINAVDLDPPFRPKSPGWELSLIDVTPLAAGGPVAVFRNQATGRVEQLTREVGLGAVTFLGFSLRDEKLADWAGRLQLPLQILENGRRRVLFAPEETPPESLPSSAATGEYPPRPPGRFSLAGLRTALDNSFANDTPVETPRAGIVASFLLLYLLAVVPLNYFIFGWFRRREVAWLAVPLWAASFSVLAYVVGYMGQQGRLTVNQVCVIEAGARQSEGMARTFLAVYAPRRGNYQLEFRPADERAADPEAAPGHLVSPALQTRGISDTLPELDIQEEAGGTLKVERLLVFSRSTRRLELLHRVALGHGVQVERRTPEGGTPEFSIRNETDYQLMNPAVLVPGPGDKLRGVRLEDLPPHMAAPRVVPQEPSVDQDEAFFGRKSVFASARGPDAADRAQAVGAYVRERVAHYREPVLVAWVDGGVLPVQIARDATPWPHVERGLTLFILPVGGSATAGAGSWQAWYSGDVRIDPALAEWHAVALPEGQVKVDLDQKGTGQCLLKLSAPPSIRSLQGRQLRLSLRIRPTWTVTSSFAARVRIEVAEWGSDGRLARWQSVYSSREEFGNPTVSFTSEFGGNRVGPGGSLLLRFSVTGVKAPNGGFLAIEDLRPTVTGKSALR